MLKAIVKKPRAAFIASKGTLDMAYPPLILATSAAALDMEAAVFFTFYGLDILNKGKNHNLKVPPLGNPAMPVPVPNIIGVLPGMTAMATKMMNDWMRAQNVPTIVELLDAAKESGVRLIACQMTMDVMGTKKEDLIDGVEFGGAAMFLDYAADSQINMFI
ncbi:MAG: DsrE/DsrF/DrsH-like family protein [Deltaproteobacteria bacterium]|nr:DsrE/DsrF/DrsH-like family protein [Deltaproteobacteria bacterium]